MAGTENDAAVSLEQAETGDAGDVQSAGNVQSALEESTDQFSFKKRVGLLLRPFIDLKKDSESKTVSFTVVPESIRMYFYLFFWSFCAFAMIVTLIFAPYANPEVDGRPFNILEDNLIKEYYGANNICIFWDVRPFSFMSAFCFLPTIFSLVVYLFFDAVRVYFNYDAGDIAKGFYSVYVGFSAFTCLGILGFLQSFATQPEQSMAMHSLPFLFLTYGLWTMAFFHLLYFLKMKLIRRGGDYYYLGIAYCVAMGITVVLKSMIDIPNAFGAHTFDYPGWEFTADLSGWNDKMFMLIVTIMPFVIYYIFAIKLDHIRVTIECVPNAARCK